MCTSSKHALLCVEFPVHLRSGSGTSALCHEPYLVMVGAGVGLRGLVENWISQGSWAHSAGLAK